MFDIPVVVFLFRRSNTLPQIFARLAEIQPHKLYLIADAGRNNTEKEESLAVRKLAESLVTWECKIIKHYADENRGVYKNIGEGAKWVFSQEDVAIFIEDDNLPEISFFEYAKELLERYEKNENILWICGTNYVPDMHSNVSYKFTRHLLPCGWASWSSKFLQLYDGELVNIRDKKKVEAFKKSYGKNQLLRIFQYQCIINEYNRFKRTGRFISWDYQMLWSVRSNNMYGVVPMRNQIKNIGIDNFSTHGGNSKTSVMTDRFCEIDSLALSFPLVHPSNIEIDMPCEDELAKIICPPTNDAVRRVLSSRVKILFDLDTAESWKSIINKRKKR